MYTIVVADDEEELRRAIIRKIDWESIGFQVVGRRKTASKLWNWWRGWNRICCLRISGCLLSSESSWQDRSERYVLTTQSPS